MSAENKVLVLACAHRGCVVYIHMGLALGLFQVLYKIGKHFKKGSQLGLRAFIVLNKAKYLKKVLGMLSLASSKYPLF